MAFEMAEEMARGDGLRVVNVAHGCNAQRVFVSTSTVTQARSAFVAGACIDF
jgi:hypothetical protein